MVDSTITMFNIYPNQIVWVIFWVCWQL